MSFQECPDPQLSATPEEPVETVILPRARDLGEFEVRRDSAPLPQELPRSRSLADASFALVPEPRRTGAERIDGVWVVDAVGNYRV